MLEYLRNASEKPIAKILITILAFSFIGWGVAEWIFGGGVSDTTLAHVGGEKITVQQFSNAKSQELSSLSREEQRLVYTDPVEMQKLTDRVLQNLASVYMVERRARDMGVLISEHRIAEEIRAMSDFQENGQFSASRFDAVLASVGHTEESFADILRGRFVRSLVMGPVGVALNVPEFAVTATYNARNAMRDIEYTAVAFNDFKVDKPSEEQLRTFYAQNPHTVPETRFVSYVLIPAKMEQPDSYDAGFSIAQRVEDDIIAGETMANVAKRHNVNFVNAGELNANTNTKDEIMDSAMISRVFRMDEETETELLETKSGFVIARVDKVVPEHNAEFESVRNSLVSDWRKAEQKKQAYIRANEILVDLNKSGKMTKAKKVSVSRTDGAPIGVLNAVFNKGLQTNSLVETDDAFYVLHIDNEKMPTPNDKKKTAIKTELQEMTAKGISEDYDSFLKRKYPIKINDKVYHRYFAK